MILHGTRLSPFVRKALVVLEEKRIPYDNKQLMPLPKTPELMRMHPMGKIPILETDSGDFVPDSSVVCAFLERLQPQPALYPADPLQFARALFLEEYADTKVVEAIGPIIFERLVKPNLLQQPTDEARVQTAWREHWPPVADYLESQVGRNGAPAQPTIGDIAVACHLANLRVVGFEIDAQRWPGLARFAAEMWARPSFVKASS